MKRMHLLTALILTAGFAVASAQTYTADTQSSKLNWTGQKVTGTHTGTVSLASGEFTIKDGKVASGTFKINMNSITSTDLADNADMAGKLVGHLKSDDFFGTEAHPTSTFTITGSTAIAGGNATVTGDLTIKGVTHPVTFKAVLADADGGKNIYGNIVVDRTLYDVKYGSGKFFEGLADRTIYDEFTIALDVHTKAK
ncbi:MAG: YceI family protein [Bacteroidales bacterium]